MGGGGGGGLQSNFIVKPNLVLRLGWDFDNLNLNIIKTSKWRGNVFKKYLSSDKNCYNSTDFQDFFEKFGLTLYIYETEIFQNNLFN